MAQTEKGIIYPFDYNEVADVPADLKALAESIDALLNDYSLNTDSGNKIVLEMNNTTYKIKAILKDKDNNVINTSNEIDLSLENMVTNVAYNNQKLILTHQDGHTTEVSIADLIGDLASKEEVEELQSKVNDLESLVETELESNEVEGTEIDVSDSAEYPGKIIPGANLEQASYNGYNIMASPYQSRTTVTQYTNILYNVDTENRIQANKTYTVSVKGKPGDKYRVTGGQYGVANTSVILTIDTNGIGIATFTTKSEFTSDSTGILSNYTADNTLPLTDICIAEGTYNELPFEPYCGGPSPNPDYPQPIKVVTGDNVVKHVGKNFANTSLLFGNSSFYSINSNNEVSIIANDNRAWTNLDGTNWGIKLKAGTYTISFNSISPGNIQIQGLLSGQIIRESLSTGSRTFTLVQDDIIGIKFLNISNYPYNAGHVQIEQGTTPTSYEPYREEEFNLDLWKENEFDSENANVLNAYFSEDGKMITSSNKSKTLYIPCKANCTYKITKKLSARFRLLTTNALPDISVIGDNFIFGDLVNCLKITTGSNAKYLCVFFYNSDYDTLTVQEILDSIQIQEAIELCKIGDYQDILFKNVVGDENYNAELEDGAWYKKGVIQKEIFDGSIDESWQINSGAISDKTIYLTSDVIDNKLKENYMGISNYLINSRISLWSTEVQAMQLMTNVSRHIRLRVDKTTASNTDGFRTWLSTHNLELYYASAETTYTQITDSTLISQLEALRKAKWFKGTNHWWTETENLEPNLKGTYKQSNNIKNKAKNDEQDERLTNIESRLALLE